MAAYRKYGGEVSTISSIVASFTMDAAFVASGTRDDIMEAISAPGAEGVSTGVDSSSRSCWKTTDNFIIDMERQKHGWLNYSSARNGTWFPCPSIAGSTGNWEIYQQTATILPTWTNLSGIIDDNILQRTIITPFWKVLW